jgi:mannose-6-phosphate isomerase-like protein (cupin superfamily)
MKRYTCMLALLTYLVTTAWAQEQGYVLKRDDGEVLLNGGIIIKVSPDSGSQGGEMVFQSITPKFSTGRHVHLRADEFFYVASGKGSAYLGKDEEIQIEAGDVVFVPKGEDHKLVNTQTDKQLELIFFLDKPGLAEAFRAMHRRFKTSDEPMTLEELNAISKEYGTVFKTLQ